VDQHSYVKPRRIQATLAVELVSRDRTPATLIRLIRASKLGHREALVDALYVYRRRGPRRWSW